MKKILSTILLTLAVLMPAALWAQGLAGDSTAVAAPTFRFDGDLLYIETETEGASIFYQMADLPNMDEATIEKISSDMTVTADGQQSIYYHQPIEITKSVIIKAIAADATVSEVSTLVYDYDAWQKLSEALDYGMDVSGRASDNSNVPDDMKEQLTHMLEEGKWVYYERMWDRNAVYNLTNEIMQLAHQIEEMMGSDVPVVNYSFDSFGVLWVDSDVTMAQVMEEASKMHNVANHITAIVWHSSKPLTNADLQEFDNPNMLIYVASDSLAPQNRNNVVVGDFAKNIVLKDVESGNGNFYCPQEFTAEMISYTHEYKQKTEVGVSRGWETIVLPFNVQTIMHEKNGLIAPFGNSTSDKHFWLRQLTYQGLEQATAIQANWPYLISMPNSETYTSSYNLAGRVTFSAQNVVVPETEEYGVDMYSEEGGMVMMHATFSGVSKSAGVYALNVGEARGNNPEGSVFEVNYRDIRPFEAYTIHEGNGPAPQFIPVAGITDGEATGIEDIRGLISDGRGETWYDLNGRKLLQKPIKKGVYIQNGSKVVIK